MTGPKSLEICSKTAMKGRGSPPSRIHHSRRNILPTLCWASTTTFTDQSKPRPRKQSTRHLRSGLTQVTFRSARWSWLWVTKVQKSRLNHLLSARAHGKWWTVARPRCPKNMKLSSASSRISRLCTRTLAKTWKNFWVIFKMVWTRVGKALDELRVDLAASKLESSSNMDQAKAKAPCQKLTDWKEKGSQHLDGLKALKRRSQALLEGYSSEEKSFSKLWLCVLAILPHIYTWSYTYTDI